MKKCLQVLTFLCLLLISACGSGDRAPTVAGPTLEAVPSDFAGKTNPFGPKAAAAGGEVFSASCQSCHGAEGHGDGPAAGYLDPHPKNLAQLQSQAGDDYLFWVISTGRPGTAMISWQGILSDDQIWQLVAFIRTLH